MTNMQRIKTIARRVRKWAEKLQHDRPSLWSTSLGGMCGICAYEIFKRARRAGIRCRVAMSCHHAFVLYRGHIIDVTATQFGGSEYPKVLFRKLADDEEDGCWEVTAIFDTVKAVRKEMNKWLSCHNPFALDLGASC